MSEKSVFPKLDDSCKKEYQKFLECYEDVRKREENLSNREYSRRLSLLEEIGQQTSHVFQLIEESNDLLKKHWDDKYPDSTVDPEKYLKLSERNGDIAELGGSM